MSESYSPDEVASYFDNYGAAEWERLVRTPAGEVKLHLHTHYLQAHVTSGVRVLEVGAGPGRFTQILAAMRCRVVVADISQVQLDLNRANAERLGFAGAVERWMRLDVSDMRVLSDESFDAVVCYGGPLSYVFERREAALGECIRVTKPGGNILLSVMSIWGSAHTALPAVLDLPSERNWSIIRTGDTFETNHPCHMYRSTELRRLLARPELALLAISASNCLSTCWDDDLGQIRNDAQKWGDLLRMEVEACAEDGCLDMGTHIIAVVKKKERV